VMVSSAAVLIGVRIAKRGSAQLSGAHMSPVRGYGCHGLRGFGVRSPKRVGREVRAIVRPNKSLERTRGG
jgi:hypothetical protein